MKTQDAFQARFGDAPDVPHEAECLGTIANRGVCRAFRADPVAPALIQTLCAAALSSPSKSDLQQRDIVIVRDAGIRQKLDQIAGFDWVPQAPELVVFCANNARFHACHDLAGVPMTNDHLDGFFNASVDAAIALSAFVLAAEQVGLGCCPLSVLRNQCDTVSDLLGLPDRVIPIAGLAVGWPAREATIAPRLSLAATVHVDRFNADLAEGIREYDDRRPSPARQRLTDRFGEKDDYGWSDDKARQYADPQRADFGAHVRAKGFNLS